MDINTLEFWRIVEMDFLSRKCHAFCEASLTFKSEWNFCSKDDIVKLAKEFIADKKLKEWGVWSIKRFRNIDLIGRDLLFYEKKGEFMWQEHRDIRIEFVNWCIEKFSTQNNKS